MSTILFIRSVTALNVVGFVLRQQGGMAVHTYNLSVQETWGKDQKFEASLRYMRPCLKVIFFLLLEFCLQSCIVFCPNSFFDKFSLLTFLN